MWSGMYTRTLRYSFACLIEGRAFILERNYIGNLYGMTIFYISFSTLLQEHFGIKQDSLKDNKLPALGKGIDITLSMIHLEFIGPHIS